MFLLKLRINLFGFNSPQLGGDLANSLGYAISQPTFNKQNTRFNLMVLESILHPAQYNGKK